MRKVSTLVGLMSIALCAGARAEEGVPAAPSANPTPTPAAAVVNPPSALPPPAPVVVMDPLLLTPPPEQAPRFMVGLSFLPMGMGKATIPVGAMEVTSDASFAYGFGFSANLRLIEGLSVGLAPQVIYNVKDKVNPSQLAAPPAAREYDMMARVAYTFPVVETIGIYVEVLPGYSFITLAKTDTAKGLVVAFGGGVTMDVTKRAFANLGAGYQVGFQSISNTAMNVDDRTKYLRVELGGGVKF